MNNYIPRMSKFNPTQLEQAMWSEGADFHALLAEYQALFREQDALLRRVTPYPDGRYDVLSTGSRRFRLRAVDDSGPYLRAEVEWLDEAVGDERHAAALAPAVADRFRRYRLLVGAEGEDAPTLPDDATALSYLVAAAIVLDSGDRQRLLATPTAEQRLQRLLALLTRELALVRLLSAVPATDLLRTGVVPN